MGEPIYTTVAFKIVDKAAFDAFWTDIRTRYKFADGEAPTQAFAVSMGDMFAEQEAIDNILSSDLDLYDMKEVLSKLVGCKDIPALLAEYDVQVPA